MPKERIDVLELLRKGAWTATWTFSGRHSGFWWTGSLKPRSRPRSVPDTANGLRAA